MASGPLPYRAAAVEADVVDSSDVESDQQSDASSPEVNRNSCRRVRTAALAVTCLVALAGGATTFQGKLHTASSEAGSGASVCPALADCSGFPGSNWTAGHAKHGSHMHPSSPQDFISLQQDLPPGAAGILVQSYYDVFKSGNRNSAGHLWASFILRQSGSKDAAALEDLFTGYCGVSGSVVVPISEDSRWRVALRDLSGVEHTGFMYYCTGCMGWPCLCDARENIKLDTKTVTLAGGVQKQYKFAVLGDPCKTPAMKQRLTEVIDDPEYRAHQVTLQMAAPEIRCDADSLAGATLSDHGHVILTMFHEDRPGLGAQNEHAYDQQCASRSSGAGMGPIFRTLAGVNPL